MRKNHNLPMYWHNALLVGTAILLSSVASAATIYKWRDGFGVIHFSQELPAPRPAHVEVIELGTPRQPPGIASDYYSIVNQARRMEEARHQRERARFERRLAVQQANAAAETSDGDTYDERNNNRYAIGYPYYYRSPFLGHRPHFGHGHRFHGLKNKHGHFKHHKLRGRGHHGRLGRSTHGHQLHHSPRARVNIKR